MNDRCAIEPLEQRMLLCAGSGHDGESLVHKAKGGPARIAPPIRLDLVALHEFGHSLGLDHNNDRSSIMYSYYNESYDKATFGSDVAVQQLREIYSQANVDAGATPWKDSLDGSSDGTVSITYSFINDGAMMEQRRKATTQATFSRVDANWISIFELELQRWSEASNGTLAFRPFSAAGAIEADTYPHGIAGQAQGDVRFGDIRIAAHKFDGASKTLAHAYYPPPNGGTVAGDVHFDEAENWVLASTGAGTFLASAGAGWQLSGSTFSAERIIDVLNGGGELLAA